MKKIPSILKYVDLQSVGEQTEQNFRGGFQIKVILTHDERFAIERIYKSMLPDDNGVEQKMRIKCAGIAELEKRVVESPQWWKDSRGGRDLIDDAPIYDLIVAVEEKFKEWKAELGKVSESGSNGSDQ